MISHRFLAFLLSGGVAAAANFGSRILFSVWLPYTVAIVMAFVIGLATAFLLMRRFAFTEATNEAHTQVLWFILINLFALLQTLAISLLLARWLLPAIGLVRGADTIAHAVGVSLPVITSYFGHKYLSFRPG